MGLRVPLGFPAALLVPALLALAGCGGTVVSNTNSSNGTFSVSPGTAAIDTNCTGCNTTNSSGGSVEQFTATLKSGGAAKVTWSVSGGDAAEGPGTITQSGQYTPPGFLTADSVKVTVTAALESNTGTTASAALTVTPGFLQPLSPEDLALGSAGTATVTGYIAEAGGSDGIGYALSSTATGSSGGQGSLSAANCSRSSTAFTYCTVTYTAPATLSATAATYIVGTAGTSSSKASAEVLLNTEGVNSNPTTHESQLATPISLGSSGGNNNDYDTTTGSNGQSYVADCCSGTLGSLIENSSGTQYLLSNNHVLAMSDQGKVGDTIIQPGLVDDNCTPYGQSGSTAMPVGTLTAWLPLSSASTNADAAIAQVDSGAVNTSGNILELGTLSSDGLLAAAPPGISSTGGKGESASLNMTVAKSGRTTGLTCANISVIDLTVEVSYYTNCAETDSYLTKTYTNQIGITGNEFSDAGDSGSLVVDSGDAEPVGLFFAGGVDNSGGSEGVANPATDVLSELDSAEGTTYKFVGTTDHPVSCLNYGAGTASATATAAQSRAISDAEIVRGQTALGTARQLVNPSAGILGVATGKSNDRAGKAAILVYVNPGMKVSVPATIGGVRTVVIPSTAQAVAAGTAPLTPAAGASPLAASVLTQAAAVKQQMAKGLMQQNPAFFGVGVGQSYDDPSQAALVIYVDKSDVPASLPTTIDGLRTRYVVMPRLHVTRSYLSPIPTRSRCMSRPAPRAGKFDPLGLGETLGLKLR